MLCHQLVTMKSLNNNDNQNLHPSKESLPTSGIETTIPANYGVQFLDAVRENDVDTVSSLAELLTSKCRIFSTAVPSLTRGLFDENASVRSNAAYLLSEGLHWIHAEDLNSWVIPSLTRALGTLDAHGPLIWLSKNVGSLANQITDRNAADFVMEAVRAFEAVDIEAAGLVAIAPFGNRLEKNIRHKVLATVCDVLQIRTRIFSDSHENSELPARDPLRKMLASVGISIMNFTASAEHLRLSNLHSQDLVLMERLEGTLLQYVRSAMEDLIHHCRPLSIEDKSIILPIAASMGNSSIDWNSLFGELERQMHEQQDPFSSVLCRLTGGRRIADPLTVITQARDELLSGKEFLLVVSTLESAYRSLTLTPFKADNQRPECMDLLQEIQELTLSPYVAFFAQRVREMLSHSL